MTTVAVVVGKLEVMLTQALAEILRMRDHFDSMASNLSNLQARVKTLEEERSRRPSWPVIVTVIVGIITLAIALGIIDTVRS